MAVHNELLKILFLYWVIATAAATSQVSKPGCQDKCGNLSIPYPFGTTEDCYLNTDFMVACNETVTPPRPVLWYMESNLEVLNISLDGELRVLTFVATDCYDRDGNQSVLPNYAYAVLPTFPFSYTRNKFIAIGCDTSAALYGPNVTTGCLSVCNTEDNIINGSCSGIGCCQTSIPKGLYNYNGTVTSYKNHVDVWSFNPCSYTFLTEEDSFDFSKEYLSNFTTVVPTILDWAVGNETCIEAEKNLSTYACKLNSSCYDSDNGPGYRCICSTGYHGNPYLPNGCEDIDECEDPKLNNCENKCINTMGSFNCTCPKWHSGDGLTNGKGCIADQTIVIKIIVGIGVGLMVLVICSSWLYWGFKKRRLIQLKHKFFKRNGGLMLQQQLSKREGYSETAKIYMAEELEKATDKYADSRIVGQGGFGTVYKGILADGRVVAIKKSKLVDQSQIEQFVNEVLVLSQINHRNVVRLLGCCLETEVPLLVYEFVSNGTLFEHIHDESKASAMPWNTRLRIAAETAGVLSYLHSAASVPIIHRDVKSTNILLDENYIAKVSDFGASRLIPIDQTELSTMVQGTLGYLDPEYLLTSQLTEKSDVYSFGVVLVELLTGKMPLSFDRPEAERSLANYFLASLKEERLFEVVDDSSVLKEGNTDQIREVANLAKRCLRVKGDERPIMKEVAMELEGLIRMMGNHPWADIETNLEETQYLLRDGDTSNQFGRGSSANTSIVYDSIKVIERSLEKLKIIFIHFYRVFIHRESCSYGPSIKELL